MGMAPGYRFAAQWAEEGKIASAGWTGPAGAAELELAADAVTYAVDTDGIVRSWSTAAERLFGYPEDEIVGRYARALTPHLTLEPMNARETEALCRDGVRVPVALTITPAAAGM